MILLDSADVHEARRAMALGWVAGVTTNPALVAKAARPGLDILRELLDITPGEVFYQVTAEDAGGRDAQAREASALAPGRVLIKIPATTPNFTLAAALAADGVRCAITAVSGAMQAYLSAQVDADYTIPYVSRLTRQLGDGIAVVRDAAAAVRGTPTRVLAASLKSPEEVAAALLAGAQAVTLPLDLLLRLGDHPLSEQAIADFAAAQRG